MGCGHSLRSRKKREDLEYDEFHAEYKPVRINKGAFADQNIPKPSLNECSSMPIDPEPNFLSLPPLWLDKDEEYKPAGINESDEYISMSEFEEQEPRLLYLSPLCLDKGHTLKTFHKNETDENKATTIQVNDEVLILIPNDGEPSDDISSIKTTTPDSHKILQLLEKENFGSHVEIEPYFFVFTPHGLKFCSPAHISVKTQLSFKEGTHLIFHKDNDQAEWSNKTETFGVKTCGNEGLSYSISTFSWNLHILLSHCYSPIEKCVSYLANVFNKKEEYIFFRVQYRSTRSDPKLSLGLRQLRCLLSCTIDENTPVLYNGNVVTPDKFSPVFGLSKSERKLVDGTHLEVHVSGKCLTDLELEFSLCEKEGQVRVFDCEASEIFPVIDLKKRNHMSGQLTTISQVIDSSNMEPEELITPKVVEQLTSEKQYWRKVLQNNYVNLTENLMVDDILSNLYEKGVVSQHEFNVLRSCAEWEKSAELLFFLNKKDKETFIKFIDILETKNMDYLIPKEWVEP